MAQVSARLAGFANEAGQITCVYNDANGTVASVTVANNAESPVLITVWPTANPANVKAVTVPPGAPVSFTNIAGVFKYSPVELAPGDPRTGNIGYSIMYPAP